MNKSIKTRIAATAAFTLLAVQSPAADITYSGTTTTLSEDTTASEGSVFFNDATVNLGAYNLRGRKFQRNGDADSYVNFGGGTLRTSTATGTNPQIFEKNGSGVLHLVGSASGDIRICTHWDASAGRSLFKTWGTAASSSPMIVTEGDCDVVFGNDGNANNALTVYFQCFGSSLNDKAAGGADIGWNHTGDLIFNGARQTIVLGNDNILPAGAQTGGVVVDYATTTLDFNGKTEAVNALEVRQGLVTNSAATAATLVLGTNNRDENISGLVNAADLKGDFNYEKAGSGTLTIDKGSYGTLTVADGAVAFAATAATPEGGAITVDSLVVNSATMGTLVVDGVSLTVGTASGSALGGVAVVTRNGGIFNCGTWGVAANNTLRNTELAAGDTLVKLGTGTTTFASSNSVTAVHVADGTLRFREPYLTGGSMMMLKYTFKKTGGVNQNLKFAEIRMSGWNDQDIWGNNILQASSDISRYPVAASISALADGSGVSGGKGGVWASGTSDVSPSYLFDTQASDATKAYNPTDTVPAPSDSTTWQQVAFRVYWWNPAKKIFGYNFAKSKSSQLTEGMPVSWMVEASTNGTDWVVVDEQADVDPPLPENTAHPEWYANLYYNGGTDFPVVGLGAECGIGSAASVRVDAGATLDVEGLANSERTISALEIDMVVGGGRITTFAPAANGVLDIVNFSGTLGEGTDLGLTFDAVVGAANLNTWTVRVNGVAKPKRLAARDGKLVVVADATVITFR